VPFEKLVDELGVERDPSRTPLFQVLCVLQNAPEEELSLAGLEIDGYELPMDAAKFDLSVTCEEIQDELRMELEYSTDLFEAATVERMAGHLQALLGAIARAPQLPVRDLPALTGAERAQLEAWNRTGRAHDGRPVHRRFEEQAARTPDAVALVCGERQLTYGELNRRANQVAHHLQGLGVEAEARVAVCLERTPELVVALLGTLKAGGAYLPLDPEYPAERLAYMVSDSGATVVLTQRALRGLLPAAGAEVVELDAPEAAIGRCPEVDPEPAGGPGTLAYVIYTSGSTGQPKGVMVEHRSLSEDVAAVSHHYGLEPGDRVLQFVSASFDPSLEQVLTALTCGAAVVLRDGEPWVGAELLERIRRHGVTVADVTPAYWHPLVSELERGGARDLGRLRLMILGGDVMGREDVAGWWRWAPGVTLLNAYGPTEATITTTLYEVPPEAASLARVPIGRPVVNTTVEVLDGELRQVPVGVPGELCIGGPRVARGYLERPGLTAERFVPDACGGEGARLYRTGDRVRWLGDGNLEYLGRLDEQVKVRGARVEPGEIEAVLGRHPGVGEVVVDVRGRDVGAGRLVAYVMWRDGATPDVGSLRERAAALLPGYMVPSAWVELGSLPLTPSGKVDRRRLPEPEREERGGYEAPRDEVESALAEVWSEVLRLERVGVHDNFFELGGDSILSIQVVAQCAERGLRVTSKQLFQQQSIAALREVVEHGRATAERESGVGPVPLTPIQRWHFEELARPGHYSQAMVLRVSERVGPEVLERALGALVAEHDQLRARFTRDGAGEWRQEVREVSAAPEPELVEAPAGELEAVMSTLQAERDLGRDPMLRAALLSTPAGQPNLLFLDVHHLVMDGVSWRVLVGDLEVACAQLIEGRDPRLAPATTPFRRWAELLHRRAAAPDLLERVAEWSQPERERAGRLPLDLTSGRNLVSTTDTVSVSLDAGETRLLLQKLPAVYRTQINEVLLTGLGHALAEWSGSRWVQVSVEGHGREELFDGVDLSRTVGWFTTEAPVLLELPESGDTVASLRRMRGVLRGLGARLLEYGLLRYLGPSEVRERLRTLPQAEVTFNYLGQWDNLGGADGLLQPAEDVPAGMGQAADAARTHLLDVSAMVVGGCLQVDWIYSRELHRRETVTRWAERMLQVLRGLLQA
jgi:amino acid adenylation domain-containing protein/non-ribosomal peptide synthase protein (TIGR01720 family)